MEESSHCDPYILITETCDILLTMQFETKIAEPSWEENGKLRDENLSIIRRVMRWFPWPGWDCTNSCSVYCFTFTSIDPKSFICRVCGELSSGILPFHCTLCCLGCFRKDLTGCSDGESQGGWCIFYQLWALPCPLKTKHPDLCQPFKACPEQQYVLALWETHQDFRSKDGHTFFFYLGGRQSKEKADCPS